MSVFLLTLIMTYSLISLPVDSAVASPFFLEGAVLAANFTTQPLTPETWLIKLFGRHYDASITPLVEQQIQQQYTLLKRNEYSVLTLVAGDDHEENLADFAEGFMQVWPEIEAQWQSIQMGDGTLRMLQALLTCFMLAIDEEQTQQQMREAGFDAPPALDDMLCQLDLMVAEVAMAADAALIGSHAQSINPYKQVGRNDICPCGSGKKFKQCCGQ